MSLQEFNYLDELDQLEVFWDGIFVGERRDGEFRIICHQVEDFYIEYKILGGHYIQMCCFRNPNYLLPYLDKINIDDLRD